MPDDWSDLLCALELRSTDDLPPAALAIAPLNPSRHGPDPVFHFRVARNYGYGAAPEMAQRCLARLDERTIRATSGSWRRSPIRARWQRKARRSSSTTELCNPGGDLRRVATRLQLIKTRARTLANLQLELATLELKAKAKALGIAAALCIVALVLVLYAIGFAFASAAAASRKPCRSGRRCSSSPDCLC